MSNKNKSDYIEQLLKLDGNLVKEELEARTIPELKLMLNPKSDEDDFVKIDKSEELQKQGYEVIEIIVEDGITKHRLIKPEEQ